MVWNIDQTQSLIVIKEMLGEKRFDEFMTCARPTMQIYSLMGILTSDQLDMMFESLAVFYQMVKAHQGL